LAGVVWIQLAQDRDQWQAVVNMVTYLQVLAPQSSNGVRGKDSIPASPIHQQAAEKIAPSCYKSAYYYTVTLILWYGAAI
jgi:hypothetical protein